jgi:hypothetical protein
MSDFHTEPHTMTRVEAAPALDRLPIQRIVESGGTWDDVRTAVAKNARNELMRYATIDGVPLLEVAGHRAPAIEYLVGNP